MTKCINCGKENPNNSNYCGACGNSLIPKELNEETQPILVNNQVRNVNAQKPIQTIQAPPPPPIPDTYKFPSYSNSIYVDEIERTCSRCGQVWFSLASREKSLQSSASCNTCQSGCMACSDLWVSTAAEHNAQTDYNELSRLRRCPRCGSSSYRERLVRHPKL